MADNLLVICGPTATGKTDLGVRLAKKFNGEIVSADSRQVYKGMDIMTGKDLPESSKLKTSRFSGIFRQSRESSISSGHDAVDAHFSQTASGQNSNLNINNNKFEVGYRIKDEVPVWLVDIVEPDYPFSAGEYAVLAQKVISDIWTRKKLPIIVGGTGFYIRSVINPYDTYMIPPDKALRSQLEKVELENLQKKLTEGDLARWNGMNDSDKKNPRRLIRAIEVAKWKKNYSQKFSGLKAILSENIFVIGLRTDFKKILRERIYKRIEKRINQGAIEEVKKLMEKKYSWFLSAFTSTGASELKDYIENKQTLDEAIKSWRFQEIDYAKRQIVWFRKDKRIKWFDISKYDYRGVIEETVAKWYTPI